MLSRTWIYLENNGLLSQFSIRKLQDWWSRWDRYFFKNICHSNSKQDRIWKPFNFSEAFCLLAKVGKVFDPWYMSGLWVWSFWCCAKANNGSNYPKICSTGVWQQCPSSTGNSSPLLLDSAQLPKSEKSDADAGLTIHSPLNAIK